MTEVEHAGYHWADAELTSSHDYLLPAVLDELNRLAAERTVDRRLFDLGCGNGSVARVLVGKGWDVTGVDPSAEGVAQADTHHPGLRIEQGSAYEDLAARYGQYPIVMSLEVVEHLYFPKHYAATLFSIVEAGGTAIVSTPYHGYWKNLAMALAGKMDAHFTALWDHGHIKFWSFGTLSQLLRDAGFVDIEFRRVGRVPPLAKSMIAIARKP